MARTSARSREPWASGNLAAGAPMPRFGGGVTIANGRMQHCAIAGNGDVHVGGDTANLNRVVGALGGTYFHVAGSLGSLSAARRAYALTADVPAATSRGALHAFTFPGYSDRRHVQRAGYRRRAAGRPPSAGTSACPPGASTACRSSAAARRSPLKRGASVREGYVHVGTTGAALCRDHPTRQEQVHVDAPHADLSDFNNFSIPVIRSTEAAA